MVRLVRVRRWEKRNRSNVYWGVIKVCFTSIKLGGGGTISTFSERKLYMNFLDWFWYICTKIYTRKCLEQFITCYNSKFQNRGVSVKKWLRGSKSRSKQSEVEDSWGFGAAVSLQTRPGQSPENFQICVGHRITQSSNFIWNKYKGHASHEICLCGNWWWILMNIKFVNCQS